MELEYSQASASTTAEKSEVRKRIRHRTKPKTRIDTIEQSVPSDLPNGSQTREPTNPRTNGDGKLPSGLRPRKIESKVVSRPLNFAPPTSFTTGSHVESSGKIRSSRKNRPTKTVRESSKTKSEQTEPVTQESGKEDKEIAAQASNANLRPGKGAKGGSKTAKSLSAPFAQNEDPFPEIDATLLASFESTSLDHEPNSTIASSEKNPVVKEPRIPKQESNWRNKAQSSDTPRDNPDSKRRERRREPRKRPERGQFPSTIFDGQTVTRGPHGRFEFVPAKGEDRASVSDNDSQETDKQKDQFSDGPGVVAQRSLNRQADLELLRYQQAQSLNFAPPQLNEESKSLTAGRGDNEATISLRTPKPARKQKAPFYEDHITKDEALAGMKNGKYLKGVLRINQKARQDAWVTVKSDRVIDGDALIEGDKGRNRALNGDEVVIELYEDVKLLESPAGGEQTRVDGDQKHAGRTRAKVVHILRQRPVQRISGFIRPPGYVYGQKKQDERTLIANENKQTSCNFHPLDQRIPWLTIPYQDLPVELQGPNWIFNVLQKQRTIYAARITTWQAQSRTPRGKIVEELGAVGNINAETAAILADCDVDVRDHPVAALACLPETPWKISEEEISKRRDFRRDRVCTIDPETARDLDDALSVRELDNGNYEIGVHIADVSHFIQQDNALDKVARDRATTVYMVQKAIPMLPRLLCEELCSLNPAVDRLAFSVTWTLNADGVEVGPRWYGRSVIRSAVRFAYGEAQNLLDGQSWAEGVGKPIDGGHTEEQITNDVKVLLRMSKAMRARRFEKGALTINAMKLNFKLNKDGLPGVAEVYQLKDANRLIEEFMLKANISVAEKIVESFPEHSLLRQHPAPKDRPLKEFVNYAQKLGVHIDSSSSASLQEGFNALAELAKDNPVISVLQQNAVKSMQKALYMCTGLHEDREEWLHYALAVPLYTHFTSPIRRYADVIVHRLLDRALKQEEPGFEADDCEEWAKNCNVRKENARLAQDRSSMLYLCAFIEEHCRENDRLGPDTGMLVDAIVISVKDRSLDVIVPGMGLEQRIYYDASYSIEAFVHDEKNEAVEITWHTKQARERAIIKAQEEMEENGSKALLLDSSKDDSEQEVTQGEDDKSGAEVNVESAGGRKTRIAVLDKVKVWLRGDFDVSPCQVKAGLVMPVAV